RKAAPHRRHGVVDQKISEHRVAEGPADERCHHRVSQGRVPLSQPKVRKILDTTSVGGIPRAAPMAVPARDQKTSSPADEFCPSRRTSGDVMPPEGAVDSAMGYYRLRL